MLKELNSLFVGCSVKRCWSQPSQSERPSSSFGLAPLCSGRSIREGFCRPDKHSRQERNSKSVCFSRRYWWPQGYLAKLLREHPPLCPEIASLPHGGQPRAGIKTLELRLATDRRPVKLVGLAASWLQYYPVPPGRSASVSKSNQDRRTRLILSRLCRCNTSYV